MSTVRTISESITTKRSTTGSNRIIALSVSSGTFAAVRSSLRCRFALREGRIWNHTPERGESSAVASGSVKHEHRNRHEYEHPAPTSEHGKIGSLNIRCLLVLPFLTAIQTQRA
jgi:hypothetical protein